MHKTIYTIGHSNRELKDFIALLEAYNIKTLVDIRSIKKSRHNPQFNEGSLSLALKKKGIKYVGIDELGGFRKTSKDSVNKALKNPSFRGYADYMLTAKFKEGIKKLERASSKSSTAIMCAEALPWRCHRFLVSDYLAANDVKVVHILSDKSTMEHKVSKMAIKKDGNLIYNANSSDLRDF